MSESDSVDIARLGLSSGEGTQLDVRLRLEPLQYGGQRYEARPAQLLANLDVSRMVAGYSFRLRYDVVLDGTCVRCLEQATLPVGVDAREVDHPGGGEELRSPYLEGSELDAGAWARDALALALPQQILCRPDCRGLCALCGANLNEDPEHAHEPEPDLRWAKLDEWRG